MFLLSLFRIAFCFDPYVYIEAKDKDEYTMSIPSGETIIVHLPQSMAFYLKKDDQVEITYNPQGKLPQGPFSNKNLIAGCLYRDKEANVTIKSLKGNGQYSRPEITTMDIALNCSASCIDNLMVPKLSLKRDRFSMMGDGLLYNNAPSVAWGGVIGIYLGVITFVAYVAFSVIWRRRSHIEEPITPAQSRGGRASNLYSNLLGEQ
ncbi:hypothetical protein GPJ56_001996 [Histomonas meleagridis]|uniref:uncharacterized protein n=1 Tax=Histomonas meleagridis TaxID=135588 RepID=UPI00355A5BC9|nr:hypothetical protein GPJ56_001996 [Histomonas meleagridis]KAH0800927.1 hypothetical protein GO595_006243 [Histomonas meleagridis]